MKIVTLLRLAALFTAILTIPSCTGANQAGDESQIQAVTETVERFGDRLANVSLLAPPDTVASRIRDEYGPLVTPALLQIWLQDPSDAPGRTVSSPWPDRIEVLDVQRVDEGVYRVRGEVVYVTSVEASQGGAATREPIELRVQREDGNAWRISDVRDRAGSAVS